MNDWRHRFLLNLGPGMLAGIRRASWKTLIEQNKVDADYKPRAALTTALSAFSFPIQCFEEWRYSSEIQRVPVKQPVFILGHWRSGTTYLHHILTQDPQFAFPTLFDVFFPHICMSCDPILPFILGPIHRGRRLADNVDRNLLSPGEDEIAICITCGKSPLMGFAFPRMQEQYDAYLTLRSVSLHDFVLWRASFHGFLKKMALKYRRRLVLKSPTHTCRINILLDMFPDARFIHIHRHPYDVFRSTLAWDRITLRAFGFQKSFGNRVAWIIQRYSDMYEAYFDQLRYVSDERLIDIGYEDILKSPVSCVEQIYRTLDIQGFEGFKPSLLRYVASLNHYRQNDHADIEKDTRGLLKRCWGRFFEKWGYAP